MKHSRARLKQTLSAVLLAGLASACLLSNTLAHYLVTDSAEAHARLALYAVTVTGSDVDDIDVEVLETATASQIYMITNKDSSDNVSEVAMTYKFVVELSAALPAGTTMSLTDASGEITPTVTQEGKVYTFTHDDWRFAADVEDSNTVTLTFDFDNRDGTAKDSDGAINVTVSVVSEQIS